MRRRDFVKLIFGSTSAFPLGVSAQQPRKWRVGFLHPGQSELVTIRVVAFREGLGAPSVDDAEIIVRLANGQLGKLPAMAVDLVDQRVQAICAVSPPAVQAARDATQSIPIIATDLESDPVANGWAASLAHPGGNISGAFLDLPDFNGKSLQLLRDAVPTLKKAAILWHPASGVLQLDAVRSAASTLNIALEIFEVSRPSDFEGVIQAASKAPVQGALMLSSPLFGGNPQLLADLTLKNRLPAINIFPDFAQKGGLIGYGPELQKRLRASGNFDAQSAAGRSDRRSTNRAPDTVQARGQSQDSSRARFDIADIHSTQCR